MVKELHILFILSLLLSNFGEVAIELIKLEIWKHFLYERMNASDHLFVLAVLAFPSQVNKFLIYFAVIKFRVVKNRHICAFQDLCMNILFKNDFKDFVIKEPLVHSLAIQVVGHCDGPWVKLFIK